MFLIRLMVALGLIMLTKQIKPGWNTERKDLHVHGNFLDSVQQKSHLTRLDVVCGKDHMTVNMEFDEPFQGVVFSQPSSKDQQRCVHVGPHAGVHKASFRISYHGCGTLEDLKGQFHENTIIVQFGDDILEAWDEAKRLRCEWLESYEKPSSNPALHISDIDAVELNFQGDDVDCWMEIQEGKGPWARQVAGLVPLGNPLTVVIAINDNSREFDMRVKQCEAHDEKGSMSVKLTDEDGCVLRSTLLTPFVKVRDFGGKATLVAYSHFFAFKFPDNFDVYIRCVVEVCRHGCLESCPQQSVNHLVPHPRKPIVPQDSQYSPSKKTQQAVFVHSVNSELPLPGRNKHGPTYTEKPIFNNNHLNKHHISEDNQLSLLLNQLQNVENNLQKHKLAALSAFAAQPSPLPAPPLQISQVHNHWVQSEPEPNSFAHPHHITTEELEAINEKAAPQPEPNSFAHPHHITIEQLQKVNEQPQPEPNSFAHPHHRTREQLEAIANEPQPEPNSYAHPHHITTEQLRASEINKEPQPEPNSFAHPHHITTEQLQAAAINNEPQPEPNSFAHPHHITTEQLQAMRAGYPQSNPDPHPFAHHHPVTEPQPEPNSFAHPHHITREELQALRDNVGSHSTGISHFQLPQKEQVVLPEVKKQNTISAASSQQNHNVHGHPDVIAVTLVPNGEMVFRYTPLTSSTIPQPAYISRERFIPYNASLTSVGVGRSYQNSHAQPLLNEGIFFKKLRPQHPYPVPQFSPRQQQMMLSVIADRRMDEEVVEPPHPEKRAPITRFLFPSDLEEPNLRKVPHGPRLLRVRRSEPVFGVQQKFRAIAPADLAFDWNATSDHTAVLRGRREEIIYGICLSTAKFSITLSLMLFITLCSTIVSAFLFQRSQMLQRKSSSSTTSSSTLFNGQVERVYSAGHANAVADIIEIS